MKPVLMISLILMVLTTPSIILISSTNPFEDSQHGLADSYDSTLIQYSMFDTHGFTGCGTEECPYLLENRDIISRLSLLAGFDHFIIRNCRIFDVLSLNSVSNGTIENCYVAAGVTISVSSSQDITVRDNVFDQPSNFSAKLAFFSDSDCKVIRNQFLDCHRGLRLSNSDGMIISDNDFLNNNIGISIQSSPNTTVVGNELTGCGFDLTGGGISQGSPHLWYNIANNTVNGKEIGFFQYTSNIEIDLSYYGQVIFLNCNDTIINGGTLRNCTTGVRISYCNNSTIQNTSVFGCYLRGIEIYGSTNTLLQNCNIANCVTGVLMESSSYFKIVDSLIENSIVGISAHRNSKNGSVLNCIIRGNDASGLSLGHNSTAMGNEVSYNGDGIVIYGSHCLIVNNTVTHNRYVGISFEYTSDYGPPNFNKVYGNSIGWSGQKNAFDDGHWNSWDDGVSLGNRWSDYYGIGVYEIDWSSTDYYPGILPEGGITQYTIDVSVRITLVLVSLAIIAGVVRIKKIRVIRP